MSEIVLLTKNLLGVQYLEKLLIDHLVLNIKKILDRISINLSMMLGFHRIQFPRTRLIRQISHFLLIIERMRLVLEELENCK